MERAGKAGHIMMASRTRPTLVFYTHTLCPYATRVALALREKGLAFDLQHIDLANKPVWYAKEVNKKGLVPALQVVDDDLVVVESLDILKFVEEAFEGAALLPEQGKQREVALEVVNSVAAKVVSGGLRAVAGGDRLWGIGPNPNPAALGRELGALEEILAKSGGPYLCGPDVTLADLATYPFVERFEVALGIGGHSVRDLGSPLVWQWMQDMQARDSCRWAAADPTLLGEAYKKHGCLDFFDYTSYGVWDLHPHNKGLR